MEKDTAYILIETTVKIALRNIREDPERTTRNLVDMALNFSGGRFQRRFFKLAQTCLQREDSPYYGIVIDTVQHVDPDILLQFGMNLGYNSCTVGARTIRQMEADRGHNIPWTVFLQLPGTFPRHYMGRYQNIISQGETLGIHTWMLFAPGHPQAALNFAEQHPDSAFALFCDPKDISLTFLDCVGEIKNLMVVLRLTEDTETACGLLREAGLLYSIYVPYTEKNTHRIIDGSIFRQTAALHPLFIALLPQSACPDEIRSRVYSTIRRMRQAQTFTAFPFDMYGDCNFIDSIISDDSCIAGFDDRGNLISVQGAAKSPQYNLLASDLGDIFQRAFPKEKETNDT